MTTGWWEIYIHGCYSIVKIALAQICARKNSRRIWRQNASTSRSREVTDQMGWRHNAKSVKIFLGDNGEINNRWLFLEEVCVQGHKMACKMLNNTFVTVNNDFWSLVMWSANDFPWQMTSLVTNKKESLFTVTHALFFISFTSNKM